MVFLILLVCLRPCLRGFGMVGAQGPEHWVPA
jgi:hypothetical protein